MKMEELDRLYKVFIEKQIGSTISEYLDFVRREYASQKKGGVVPYEVRQTRIRLRQIEEYQMREKIITPKNDLL